MLVSTTDPQLIHSLLTGAALLFSISSLLTVFYLRKRFLSESASTMTINSLRGDVAELSGEIADLRDRFSRFQKREGMRDARNAKEQERDVLAQAKDIFAQSGSQEPQGKLALYRKMRH